MNKGCLLAAVAGVVVLLVVLLTWMGMYNGIVTQDEECNKAWANVEAVLQRRFDLIPNLVNTVRAMPSTRKASSRK
jgi:LemA protein